MRGPTSSLLFLFFLILLFFEEFITLISWSIQPGLRFLRGMEYVYLLILIASRYSTLLLFYSRFPQWITCSPVAVIRSSFIKSSPPFFPFSFLCSFFIYFFIFLSFFFDHVFRGSDSGCWSLLFTTLSFSYGTRFLLHWHMPRRGTCNTPVSNFAAFLPPRKDQKLHPIRSPNSG